MKKMSKNKKKLYSYATYFLAFSFIIAVIRTLTAFYDGTIADDNKNLGEFLMFICFFWLISNGVFLGSGLLAYAFHDPNTQKVIDLNKEIAVKEENLKQILDKRQQVHNGLLYNAVKGVAKSKFNYLKDPEYVKEALLRIETNAMALIAEYHTRIINLRKIDKKPSPAFFLSYEEIKNNTPAKMKEDKK